MPRPSTKTNDSTSRRSSSEEEGPVTGRRPPVPELLFSIKVGGYEGLRLEDCVARMKESGLSYLDNFDNAWTNVSRRVPKHGSVKLHSVRVCGACYVLLCSPLTHGLWLWRSWRTTRKC